MRVSALRGWLRIPSAPARRVRVRRPVSVSRRLGEGLDAVEHRHPGRPRVAGARAGPVPRSRPPCKAASVARARSSGSASVGRSPRACMARSPSRILVSQRRNPRATAIRAASSVSASSAPRVPSGQPPRHSSVRWCSTSRSRQARRPGVVSQVVQMGALGVQDRLGLVVDDRPDQRLLVLEIVVHLRAAHPGRRPDVLQRGLGHTPVEHQLRRGRDDPLPGVAAPARQPPPVPRPVRAHSDTVSQTGLDNPIFCCHSGSHNPVSNPGREPT